MHHPRPTTSVAATSQQWSNLQQHGGTHAQPYLAYGGAPAAAATAGLVQEGQRQQEQQQLKGKDNMWEGFDEARKAWFSKSGLVDLYINILSLYMHG